MQTSTSTTDRLSAPQLATTSLLAMPRGAFETRHQPGREVSVVDGLMSVTQHAWDLPVAIGEREGNVAAVQ